MILPEVLARMRSRIATFTPYRRRVRPAAGSSLPPFLDGEFQNLATSLFDLQQIVADLDTRLAALGG